MSERVDTERLRALAEAATFMPGYRVTMDGHVYSMRSWRGGLIRELTQDSDADGYACVRVSDPATGKRHRLRVHRLVAVHFVPRGPEITWDAEVRHLDGNKWNNEASNLAWGTALENAADRDRHGRTARGERNGFAKLSSGDVAEIRARRAAGESRLSVAAAFGIHKQTVSNITAGKARADG